MLRFSIRDLRFVMSLAAVPIGWWCEHRARASDLNRLKELRIEYEQLSAYHSIVERASNRVGYEMVCGFDKSYLVRKDASEGEIPNSANDIESHEHDKPLRSKSE